jgi:HAT1-interacting factor 1
MKEAVFGPSGNVSGILASATGQTPAEAAALIEDAKKNATDLSGLVRHKPKKAAEPAPTNGTNGKRKAEEEPEEEIDSKKTKVEDASEA